jgi:hypothetical protein
MSKAHIGIASVLRQYCVGAAHLSPSVKEART